MSDSQSFLESDLESHSLAEDESFEDFLQGFKSARMSFEPLDSWLFGRSSECCEVNTSCNNLIALNRIDSCNDSYPLVPECLGGTDEIKLKENSRYCESPSDNVFQESDGADDDVDDEVGEESDVEDEFKDNDDRYKNFKVYQGDEEQEADDSCVLHFDDSVDYCNTSNDIAFDNRKSDHLHVNIQPQPLSDSSKENDYKFSCVAHNKLARTPEMAGNCRQSLQPSHRFEADCIEPFLRSCRTKIPTCDNLHLINSWDMPPKQFPVRRPFGDYFNCQQSPDFSELDTVTSNQRSLLKLVQCTPFRPDVCGQLCSEESDSNVRDRNSLKDEGVKRAQTRKKVAQELLDTEVTYHRHLELIVKLFEDPLRETQMIADHLISGIFGNIRQIICVNDELVKRLKTMNIGEAFLKLGPFLKLYSTYANNHEGALAMLLDCDQKHPSFAQFRRQQEELEEMNGLKLNSLLITPVQRIPRYKLLLSELLKNTPSDDHDYKALAEAVKQVSAVARHINDHIKQQDNFMRMLAIQRSLACTAGPRILIPGRVFVKEGQLRKVSKRGSLFRSNDRTFFLFSDVLMYAKPRLLESGSTRARVGKSGPSLICCCIMPLHHCRVERVLGHPHGSGEEGSLFTVICKEESLLLYSDQKTVDLWIEALSKTISECKLKRNTLRRTSSARRPLRRSGITRLWKAEKQADPLFSMVNSPDKSWARSSDRSGQDSPTLMSPGTSLLSRFGLVSSKNSPSPSKTSRKRAFGLNFGCFSPRSRQMRQEFGEVSSSPLPGVCDSP